VSARTFCSELLITRSAIKLAWPDAAQAVAAAREADAALLGTALMFVLSGNRDMARPARRYLGAIPRYIVSDSR
jgi:hypothetical protein